MNRKEIARETLDIMEKGYYETKNKRIEIKAGQEHSIKKSFLLTPEQGEALLKEYNTDSAKTAAAPLSSKTAVRVWNCSTVDAILKLSLELTQDIPNLNHAANAQNNTSDQCQNANTQNSAPDRSQYSNTQNNTPGRSQTATPLIASPIAVLNFASAKNPGGGFINGAMAQEESLAASSCLYKTQTAHEDYYKSNRACNTMMYTNHAIYSPDVVFFRDGSFRLLETPVTASVLTLPAVNMGQVILKREDVTLAKQVMRKRMKLSLAVFASQKCRHLILGAYGCGVFRNDPEEIAVWWHKLLEESFPGAFETVVFAVLDKSASQACITPFWNVFTNV